MRRCFAHLIVAVFLCSDSSAAVWFVVCISHSSAVPLSGLRVVIFVTRATELSVRDVSVYSSASLFEAMKTDCCPLLVPTDQESKALMSCKENTNCAGSRCECASRSCTNTDRAAHLHDSLNATVSFMNPPSTRPHGPSHKSPPWSLADHSGEKEQP